MFGVPDLTVGTLYPTTCSVVPLGVILCKKEVVCLFSLLFVSLECCCELKHSGFDVEIFVDGIVLEVVVEVCHDSCLCCLY